MIHRKIWRSGGVALVLFGVAQLAQAQSPTPAEKAIQYRQAVFKVIAGNFGPLAQSAQGKLELTPAAARRYAERLASITSFVGEAFPDISREGETKARPEIWTSRAEFDKLLGDLTTATRSLATVSASGSTKPEDFKAAVGAVGNACKACHDQVRAK